MASPIHRVGRNALLTLTLLLSLTLSGCASRLSYQFVDIWLAWSVDDYVTLTSSQEELLDQRLEALIEWHRQTQLPRYIDWLQGFRQRVQQPMTVADFDAEFNRLNEFINDIIRHVEPDLLSLLSTLDETQIKELQMNLQKQNDEALEEYRDIMPNKRQRQREETASTNVQRFVGKLTRQERVMVRDWSRNLADIGEQRYQARDQWQTAFLQALVARNDPAIFKQAVQPLLYEPEKFRSPEYSSLLTKNQTDTFAMLATIQQALDKTQKKRLDLSLDSWLDTLKNLVAND
jgi:cell fate (sporulation/competence/biofilm development) regulator YlbF (YheA/YmcA/DUF963 family)